KPSEILRQYAQQGKINNAIGAGLLDVERARRQWAATEELSIRLKAIEAEMLVIMSDGGNDRTTIIDEANVDGNPNKFKITAGVVEQQQYTENGGLWNVAASHIELPSNLPFYVYIKADKNNESATIVYSENKIGVEQVAG